MTLALGGYLVATADVSAVSEVVASASKFWIGLAIALYSVDRFVAAFKWRLLFVAHGDRLRLKEALSIYLQSNFLGAALPATVGMDLARVRLVSWRTGTVGHALGSVIIERLLGISALAAAAVGGLLLFARHSEWMGAALPIAAVAALALLAFLLVAKLRVPDLGAYLSGRLSNALATVAGDAHASLRRFTDRRTLLAVVFAFALLQQYLFILLNWMAAQALGLDVSLTQMLWIWPLVMIAMRLPISVLGFGVREFVIYGVHGGLGPEEALALGVLSGCLDLLFIGVGGLLVLFTRARPDFVATRATTLSGEDAPSWDRGSETVSG